MEVRQKNGPTEHMRRLLHDIDSDRTNTNMLLIKNIAI